MKIILAVIIVESTSHLHDISKEINVGLLKSNNEAYKYRFKCSNRVPEDMVCFAAKHLKFDSS